MDRTRRYLALVIGSKMDFHAPRSKSLLGDMLGVGPSSTQDVPQESTDTLTVQVEAIGSGKVIIPALKLTPTTTINDIKKKIFALGNVLEKMKHFQSCILLIGHNGAELISIRDQLKDIYDTPVITVVQDEEMDRLYCGGYDDKGYNVHGHDSYGFTRDGDYLYRGNCDYDDEVYYDENGYNDKGYDIYGYDANGYDKFGYDVDGFNEYGFDRYGRDEYGYDSKGYDKFGRNVFGHDA